MTIREVYEQYKHLDELLSDREWLAEGSLQQGVLYDLWQAVKQEVQPVVAADAEEPCEVCGKLPDEHCMCDVRPDDL